MPYCASLNFNLLYKLEESGPSFTPKALVWASQAPGGKSLLFQTVYFALPFSV